MGYPIATSFKYLQDECAMYTAPTRKTHLKWAAVFHALSTQGRLSHQGPTLGQGITPSADNCRSGLGVAAPCTGSLLWTCLCEYVAPWMFTTPSLRQLGIYQCEKG